MRLDGLQQEAGEHPVQRTRHTPVGAVQVPAVAVSEGVSECGVESCVYVFE